jgi:Outer membrane protein beta-barrel domain
MRFIASVVCLLLINSVSNAQFKRDHAFFKFGVKSVSVRGDNISSRDNFILKPVVDFGFGVNYNLSNNLRFQPEIHYSPRGYKAKYNLTDSTFVQNSLELHYLDLCPNFSYSLRGHQSMQTRLTIWGGPYLAMGIAGRNVTSGLTINTKGTKADSTYSYKSSTFSNGLNRLDYGFNVGLGLQFEKFTQFGFSYSMGFNNILEDTKFPIYNQSVGVYVIVLFDDMF